MKQNSKIYVAGRNGLVGSALMRRFEKGGFTNVVSSDIEDFDLTDPRATDEFFSAEKPEYVFLAAARVGGIVENDTFPADFIRINLQIQTNIIDASHRHQVDRLLFLGSSCIYPRLAPQPLREEYLLTGPLEQTNDAYSIAKIAGIMMCQSYNRQHGTRFTAAMPTNLYGPGDNFDLASSHVMPAMIRKLHEAKLAGAPVVTMWGTGEPKREFLYVDDLADALVFLIDNFKPTRELSFLNVGTGVDLTVRELAEKISSIVGYTGKIEWDTSRPDGTPQKLLDVTRLSALGWKAEHSLTAGIEKTYNWYRDQSPGIGGQGRP